MAYFKCYPAFTGVTEENYENPQSGQLVSDTGLKH